MKQNELSPISVDTVSTWIERETEGNDGETWKVWLLNNAKTHAYVKIPHNKLSIIAELAAAQVGRAINLKIPEPFLIRIDPDDLPDESRFSSEAFIFAYGCSSCGNSTKSFERLIDGNAAILDSWDGLESTLIFDEWIANTDRNLGNLIYDAVSKTYWLIDHGRAFADITSLFLEENLTNPAVTISNDLLNTVIGCDMTYARKIEQLSNKLMIQCQTINLTDLDRDNHYQRICKSVKKEQLSNFLTKRIHHTTELICNKIGLTMMDLTQ